MAAREGTPRQDMDPHGRVRRIPSASEVAGELSAQHRERRRWRRFGGIAQLVEHVLCKHEVTGSIPVASTKFRRPAIRRACSSVG